MLRAWAILIAVLALLFVIADVSVGCYYASQINNDGFVVSNDPDEFDLRVETAGEALITLRHTGESEDLLDPAMWGVVTSEGYGRLGSIVGSDASTVTREFILIDGTITAGQPARLDKYAYPGDPLTARGLAFEEVTYDPPLGPMAAWYIAGSTDTWVIFVHGKGATRAEAIRALGPISAAGAHALVISYRNDAGAPADRSGKYQYGLTEWEDLEAAAHYAKNHGAQKIVVVGYSMGGSIAMSFMRNSLLAADVTGIVLDAPMLDFAATVDYAGERRGLPGFVTWTAKVIGGWRYGIDWDGLDYIKDAAEVKVPVLIFHGDADRKVPITTSREAASKAPVEVRFKEFPGAQHTAAWNTDAARYESEITLFIVRMTE